jgi:hypothetical protein
LIQDAVYVFDVNASWSKAFRGFKPIPALFGNKTRFGLASGTLEGSGSSNSTNAENNGL